MARSAGAPSAARSEVRACGEEPGRGQESHRNRGNPPPTGRYLSLLVQEQPPDLRPLDLAGIFDQTFDLYRSNFWLFASIAAVVHLPVSILGILGVLTQDEALMTVVKLIVVLLLLVLNAVMSGAITIAIANRYMGVPCSMVGAYKAVWPLLVPLLLTMFLGGVLVSIGTMMCCLPGIVFYFWTVFFPPLIVLERLYYGQTFERNWVLIGDHEWTRIFGVTFLMFILLRFLELTPPYSLVWLAGATLVETQAMVDIWTGLAQTVLEPLRSIAIVVLYYDVRIRKEAFDLQWLAAKVALDVTSTPFTVVPWVACSACGNTVYAGEGFCRRCGSPQGIAPQATSCPRCQRPVYPGDAFCRGCGVPTGEASATSAGPTEVVVALPAIPPDQAPAEVTPAPEHPPDVAVPESEPPPPREAAASLRNEPPSGPLPSPPSPETCPICRRRVAEAAMFCTNCGHLLVR